MREYRLFSTLLDGSQFHDLRFALGQLFYELVLILLVLVDWV